MNAQSKERTLLERRRVRAAKTTILLVLVFLGTLSVWQCMEGLTQSGTPSVFGTLCSDGWGGRDSIEGGPVDTAPPSVAKDDLNADGCAKESRAGHPEGSSVCDSGEDTAEDSTRDSAENPIDPLGIRQEGIVFMQASEDGSILWYQGMWSVSQSRALLERALILKGWQSLSTEQEQVMSFAYSPNATAGGGSLYASFYETEQGCTILVELM